MAATARTQTPATGVEFVGRWSGPPEAPLATYGGSTVVLKFKASSSITADLTVGNLNPKDPGSKLWVTVSVDGGTPQRIALAAGPHPGFTLADGLSSGLHTIELRDDNEPTFGYIQFAHPTLAPGAVWQPIDDNRPIIELIDDSGATGLCVLGPQSPAAHVPLFTSAWESQSLSFPALLESYLAALGNPAIVVDLALSGSNTRSEADTYDLAAPKAPPDYAKAIFHTYPGNRHASLVLLLGGSNDHNFGGALATGSPATYANLSPFQRGIYDQITKIDANNPGAEIVLLNYIDPIVPDWKPAYLQVQSLLPTSVQQRILFFGIKDSPIDWTACAPSPHGHPNLAMHATFAAQLAQWMLNQNLIPKP